MNRSLLLIIPLSLTLALIQTAFFSRITFLGHIPQLIVLSVVAWAMLRNLTEGFVWALIGGLFLDLFSVAPLGTSALGLMAAAGLAYAARQVLPRGQFVVPALLGTLCAAVYLGITLGLARLSGFSTATDVLDRLISYMILHALLMIPVYWLYVWVVRLLFPEPIE